MHEESEQWKTVEKIKAIFTVKIPQPKPYVVLQHRMNCTTWKRQRNRRPQELRKPALMETMNRGNANRPLPAEAVSSGSDVPSSTVVVSLVA